MKLSIGLSVALASFAAAAQQAAKVYILPQPDAATTTVTPNLARLIFLQRIAPIGKGASIHDVSNDEELAEAVSLMNQFGKVPVRLFDEKDNSAPSQLVVMLEGMTEVQIEEFGKSVGMDAAFTINNPPSASAHDKLLKNDFYNAGVTNEKECAIEQITNPFNEDCWSGKAAAAKYDVSKNSEVIEDLRAKIASLKKLAKNGEVETTIILLPTVPETATSKQWSKKTQELRRRQAETVIASVDETPEAAETSESPAPTSSPGNDPIFPKPKHLPACFKSLDSCESATKNCSGHGSCMDKWSVGEGVSGSEVCFTCYCLSTVSKQGSLTHWAGAACTKKDISVEFWLFAGFTLALLGILSLAIGMLFSVGEEKLPGVIGAGVSRSK